MILIGIRQPPAARSSAAINVRKPFRSTLIGKDSGLLKLPNTISGDFLKLTTSVPVNCVGWGEVIISSSGLWLGIKGSGINYTSDLCQERSPP